MTAPSKQLDQFVLRLPQGMRDRIKILADSNGRSMNAEIVARLEKSIESDSALLHALDMITDLCGRVEELERDVAEQRDRLGEVYAHMTVHE